MSLRYDLYASGGSWLHRLDPRVKLAGMACACGMALATRNLWLILAGLAGIQAALATAGVGRARIVGVWRLTGPTMLMIALFWALLYHQGPAWIDWWVIRITPYSLAEGLAVALRIALLAFTISAWLFTTDQTELMLTVVGLGLPFTWALTLAMALRYLPTLASALRMVSEAQQARALDLTHGHILRRARAYLPITVAMLISALRTAQQLSYALEARALGAKPQRTYLRRLHLRRADWLWLTSILLATALGTWARLAWSLGAHPLRLWGM